MAMGTGPGGPEINVTPLIDVLLVLLIISMLLQTAAKPHGEDEDPDDAYALGAHFVLRKPLHRVRVERMLRAAHVLISQERRKFKRHLCDGAAEVIVGASEIHAELVDLSHGGTALQLGKTSQVPDEVGLRFTLPGTRDVITPRAVVRWRNHWGRVGVEFTAITSIDRSRLSRWLDTRPDRN